MSLSPSIASFDASLCIAIIYEKDHLPTLPCAVSESLFLHQEANEQLKQIPELQDRSVASAVCFPITLATAKTS